MPRPPSDSNPKFEILAPLVRGRRVLDVGAVGGALELTHDPRWLHRLLCGEASSCKGIDILSEECAALRARGYDMVCADAENFCLDQTFEVVVAADVLEHLSNFGAFLRCAREALEDNGLLVLSVPNAFALRYLLLVLATGRPRVHSEHVGYFCRDTLATLVDRHGFTVEQTWHVEMVQPYAGGMLTRSRVVKRSWDLVLLLLPRALRNTIVLTARRKAGKP